MLNINLSPCLPPCWAESGHAQTILGHLLPSPRLELSVTPLEVELPDGDKLWVGYIEGKSRTSVYLFHGLGGDIGADYMERTARICHSLGHSVYLTNHRGCGEGWRLARRPLHSGRGEDLSAVLTFGKKREPHHRRIAIGFSLSGNALLCLLTGLRGEELPEGAIVVNAPIDLSRCADLLGQGFNRVYDKRFVKLLVSNVNRRAKEGLFEGQLRFPRFLRLKDFDEIFTAPAGGFKNREDYYESCSTYRHLQRIKTPTLLLTTEDDPFICVNTYRRAALSPFVRLHIEKHGGHMGYLAKEKTPLGTRRWLDYALHEGIQALRRL